MLSIEDARATSLTFGGSRNDLLVAATAAGLGRYYDEIGEHVPELRLATPTSQQRSQEPGGNWFAPARVEIPTAGGQGPRLGPQFGVVAERLAQARREPALQLASRLAATAGRFRPASCSRRSTTRRSPSTSPPRPCPAFEVSGTSAAPGSNAASRSGRASAAR